MNKKLTLEQITQAAKDINVPLAALRAVIDVECKGSGFNADGTPVILFERHVFRQRLIANGMPNVALDAMRKRPDLCNTATGAYGLYSAQHNRLAVAATFDRDSALESASWGIGQVMGYHWKALSYKSLQTFVNAMYKDEHSQLQAMCAYIRVNRLDKHLRNQDWKNFAHSYNGKDYAKNSYDVKLANAYKRWLAWPQH